MAESKMQERSDTESEGAPILFKVVSKNGQGIWRLRCFDSKIVTVNAVDKRNGIEQWTRINDYLQSSNHQREIKDLEPNYDFMILDKCLDEETKKEMISYGMLINLTDIEEMGVDENDLKLMLLDREIIPIKLEKYDRLKIKPLLEWMTLVRVSDVVHLKEDNADLSYDYALIIYYYYCH